MGKAEEWCGIYRIGLCEESLMKKTVGLFWADQPSFFYGINCKFLRMAVLL